MTKLSLSSTVLRTMANQVMAYMVGEETGNRNVHLDLSIGVDAFYSGTGGNVARPVSLLRV